MPDASIFSAVMTQASSRDLETYGVPFGLASFVLCLSVKRFFQCRTINLSRSVTQLEGAKYAGIELVSSATWTIAERMCHAAVWAT